MWHKNSALDMDVPNMNLHDVSHDMQKIGYLADNSSKSTSARNRPESRSDSPYVLRPGPPAREMEAARHPAEGALAGQEGAEERVFVCS